MRKQRKSFKTAWSKKEDKKLLENINKYLSNHSSINWTKVIITGRNFKQCKERYENQLNPNINKSKFTNLEIDTIIQKQKELGNKWKEISKIIGNNRTEGQVKNKWHSIVNKCKKNKIANMESLIDTKSDSSTFSEQVINDNNDILTEYDLDNDDWNIYDPEIFDELNL